MASSQQKLTGVARGSRWAESQQQFFRLRSILVDFDFGTFRNELVCDLRQALNRNNKKKSN